MSSSSCHLRISRIRYVGITEYRKIRSIAWCCLLRHNVHTNLRGKPCSQYVFTRLWCPNFLQFLYQQVQIIVKYLLMDVFLLLNVNTDIVLIAYVTATNFKNISDLINTSQTQTPNFQHIIITKKHLYKNTYCV
jgi:hypothetical protein